MNAIYTPSPIAAYKGNPLIEALPPIQDPTETAKQLRITVPYDKGERNLPGYQREHCLVSALQFFEPLPHHLDLAARMDKTIRFGYVGRTPLDRDYWQSIPATADTVSENMKLIDRTPVRNINTGFGLVGVSGMGKSTSVERVLGTYPQIIQHTEYKKQQANMIQIPWLKLDCPFDGSVRGLCFKFFAALDDLLGSNYLRKFERGRSTVDQLMPQMARIGKIHGMGLLVIDEIQHLADYKQSHGIGPNRMLNFFVELINTAGMPIMMIGTPKAISVLTKEFRSARRSAGQGDLVWNRMEPGPHWEFFLEALWGYQYTKKITPLNRELSAALYEESQGITDFAVKLYLLAQCRAIRTKKEEVTEAIIRSVAKDSLNMAAPFLKALKTKDFSALPNFDDIRPIDFEKAMSAA